MPNLSVPIIRKDHMKRFRRELGLAGVVGGCMAGLLLTLAYSFNLFHTLAEFFSIAVAFSIFAILWNTRNITESSYFTLVGIAFGFIAFIDLIHTMAYKGMGVFVGYDADLPTQLWIFARYLQAVTLIAAPLFLSTRISLKKIMLGYAAITAVALWSIFSGAFPSSYREGVGLTQFKIVSEYVISLILLGAAAIHYVKRENFSPLVYRFLLGAVFFSILSELTFTTYGSVFAFSNALGHIFKIAAFYCIYRAFVVTNLLHPYELLFREIKEREQALTESETRFKAISNYAYDWEHWIDREGHAVWINPAVERITGFSVKECMSMEDYPVRLYHEDDRDKVAEHFQLALQGRSGENQEFRIRTKEGKTVWVAASYQSIYDDQGNNMGHRASMRDISDLKKAEQDLQDLAQGLEAKVRERTIELERASQTKDEFLANMSHELRTPMTGILGVTEMLLEKELPSEVRSDLGLIRYSARSALTLLNDILDLSRIEQGSVELKKTDFNVREMIKNVARPFEIQAREKGLDFGLSLDESMPRTIECDPDRLGQVLKNLLSNAVKFTERGAVKLSAHVERDSERYTILRFSVSDTGIGIPGDQQDVVFHSFTQLDPSYSKKFSGIGLGLAISRRIVKLMSSTIQVESQQGHGSTFSFTLTTPRAAKNKNGSAHAVSLADLPPMHILLAEDNPVNRLFLRRSFTTAGHKITDAENGAQVLEKLKQDRFDLILMDIQMPEMDGLEATRSIRSGVKGKESIPIIALTAYAMKGDKEKFLSQGMDGYVTKPVDFQELARMINVVISTKEGCSPPTSA
ncbi:MAG: MASE3 domain-containing protein [Desulfovibrionales bacterium]